MRIIFYTHPNFLGHQSMPRFTNMLAKGMAERGHEVEIWYPSAFFADFVKNKSIKKYLGYIDQLIIFPIQAYIKLKGKNDYLNVLTDHALGPWMCFLRTKKHVVHCHDFIAQKSALGLMQGFNLGFSGKLYQSIIKNGFSKANFFISVSETTNNDLQQLISKDRKESKVVYNGLNQNFLPCSSIAPLREHLGNKLKYNLSNGFILHIGNNEWYKNRDGVLKLYDHWRGNFEGNLPLILVGPEPTQSQLNLSQKLTFTNDILFLSNLENKVVRELYAAATLLLFPSYAEGFGWPIAEAMASGCPVITTAAAPMTEIGSDAAFYISRRPLKESEEEDWLTEGSESIEKVVSMKTEERENVIRMGIENAKRFNTSNALDSVENLYKSVIKNYENTACS